MKGTTTLRARFLKKTDIFNFLLSKSAPLTIKNNGTPTLTIEITAVENIQFKNLHQKRYKHDL